MLRHARHLLEYVFHRRRLEEELDEELRSSLEMTVEQFISRGMTPAEARRAAGMDFEGMEQVKEQVRDALAGSVLRTFLHDLQYAWRGLLRRRSFAAIALITLSLGIGVNSAVFSVFHAVLMRPLPYEHPERLVLVWANLKSRGVSSISGELLREIENRQRSLSDIGGVWVTPPVTFPGDPPEQVKAALVTSNFFDVLGVHAAKGRTFVNGDAGQPQFIVANAFYERRFAGKPDTADSPIGVLPENFQLHFAPEANVPGDVQVFQTWEPGFYQARNYIIRTVGRLKAGGSILQAQEDFDRIAAEIRSERGEFGREDLYFRVTGMQDDAFRDVRPALTALFAGGAFVLLICCVNVTSLLLARAADRRKEIALRLALGASRGRIVRLLLAEAALLSLIGGASGAAVGAAVFRGLLAIRPERLARIAEPGFLWSALAFSAAAAVVAMTIFAVAPVLQNFHLHPLESLRTKGYGWLDRLHRRAGRLLVVGEMTLAFVLVTAAGLTARTLSNIEHVRPGFDPPQLLAFQLPGMSGIRLTEWEARFMALPGVEAGGAISHLPFDTTVGNWYGEYRVRIGDRVSIFTADSRAVTRGYLSAMGVRLIEGRYFDSRDHSGAPYVVIVDESLAQSTWPGESALGKTIEAEHMTTTGNPFQLVPSLVIGVVEHVQTHSLTRKVRGQIYSPFEQNTRDGFPQTFVLRTSVPPLSLVPSIRALLPRNPPVAMDKVRPMTDYLDREIAPAGFTAVLGAIFGGLALILAATGIYGVLNYQVSRRLPEMGIRMALGATTRDLLALILREGAALAVTGILVGMVATYFAAQALGALLYQVSPRDPWSYLLALLLLPAAALLACWRPAARAASANPTEMMKQE
jgi:predicted permease